ncbi:MAG: DUF2867 domain-containing protein [Micrococcales bacterium]|nr:DUF2867 domain-containing protein [Micrococcales bacterium]
MTAVPAFWSLALQDIPDPDFADVHVFPLPPGAPEDPAWWAEAIFAIDAAPLPVRALMRTRQVLVRLIGLKPSPADTFDVDEALGDEVLIAADEEHLDFRCGIGVDREHRLLRVTTTVRLHGWRGRFYFAPVSLVHPTLTRVMVNRVLRRAAWRTPSRR